MSDCLPSGLWLLVLWLWHVWTRSVFGKRSFLSRYQLTGLWHYCCLLLGSFFCAGNEFFHACFSGLGLFKSTPKKIKKAAGPKSECPEKHWIWDQMQVQGLAGLPPLWRERSTEANQRGRAFSDLEKVNQPNIICEKRCYASKCWIWKINLIWNDTWATAKAFLYCLIWALSV